MNILNNIYLLLTFIFMTTSWSCGNGNGGISCTDTQTSDLIPVKYISFLVKTFNHPGVYLNVNGCRYPIPNEKTYFQLFQSWNYIQKLSDKNMNQLKNCPTLQ